MNLIIKLKTVRDRDEKMSKSKTTLEKVEYRYVDNLLSLDEIIDIVIQELNITNLIE